MALAVGVSLAARSWWASSTAPAPPTAADVDQAVQQGIERAQEAERNVPPEATSAYRTITPSLVTVTTERPGRDGAGTVETGLGSGVVVNADGSVLTALHVVAGADRIQVGSPTARGDRPGDGQPARDDIAVLAVDRLPEVVVPAVLGGPPRSATPSSPSATRSGCSAASPRASCPPSTARSPRRAARRSPG